MTRLSTSRLRFKVVVVLFTVTALLCASCGDDLAVSGTLSPGPHSLAGDFKDPRSEVIPPAIFPWTASLNVGEGRWCVTKLTIDGSDKAMDEDQRCAAIGTGASSVAVGSSSRGSVYAIYAPGRRASGFGVTGPTGDKGSLTYSQSGPFIVVLLEGGGHATLQLLDAQRHSIDFAIS